MYLPVIIAQKNDETTASWIGRLTLANGFDNTEEFAQQFICDSDIANAQRFKAMLGTEDFISLYKALNLQGVSMWDLYMKTSCYGGIAPFLSDARQTHYLNTAFRLGASNNSIVSASNSLTSELRFCPLCKKRMKLLVVGTIIAPIRCQALRFAINMALFYVVLRENSVQNFQQAPSQFRVLIQRIRGNKTLLCLQKSCWMQHQIFRPRTPRRLFCGK